MTIRQTHSETRETPAEYESTNLAYCRLCDKEYDADDQANSYDETCCDDHAGCSYRGCTWLAHPESYAGYCANHEVRTWRAECAKAYGSGDANYVQEAQAELTRWLEIEGVE